MVSLALWLLPVHMYHHFMNEDSTPHKYRMMPLQQFLASTVYRLQSKWVRHQSLGIHRIQKPVRSLIKPTRFALGFYIGFTWASKCRRYLGFYVQPIFIIACLIYYSSFDDLTVWPLNKQLYFKTSGIQLFEMVHDVISRVHSLPDLEYFSIEVST